MRLRHQYLPSRSVETLQPQLKPVLAVDKVGAVEEVLELMDLVEGL